MVTKKEFEEYERIRETGKTNMFAIREVVSMSNGILDTESCLIIIKNYSKLEQQFK